MAEKVSELLTPMVMQCMLNQSLWYWLHYLMQLSLPSSFVVWLKDNIFVMIIPMLVCGLMFYDIYVDVSMNWNGFLWLNL